MTIRRVLRLTLASLAPLALAMMFPLSNWLFVWLGEEYVQDRDISYSPLNLLPFDTPFATFVAIWVGIAVAISIAGSLMLFGLQRRWPAFRSWHSRQPVTRLLIYRLLFTVAAWTLLTAAFAWHDGVAPPIWFRNDITGILIFALPQLVLQGAFTFPLDPHDVRRVTLLGDADVGRITAHMRGPEAESMEPPETPTQPCPTP
jgi:hypothetical protein